MVNQNHCQKCTEPIDESALACQHCGYEPRKIGHTARVVYAVVGLLLSLTVVGAIIGVPLMALAYYAHTKTQDRTPVSYNPA